MAPNFSPMEDYATTLACLEASERFQTQTSECLEEHASKFYPSHLERLVKDNGGKFDNDQVSKGSITWSASISARERPVKKNTWHRFKTTIKPAYLNTYNPILLTKLNKDGSIPSGKNREDMLKEVLKALWALKHPHREVAGGLVDENGRDTNGTAHASIMPEDWKGPVHFLGWTMLGPLSPTICRPTFALNAAAASSNARAQQPSVAPAVGDMRGSNASQTLGGDEPSLTMVVNNNPSSRATQRKTVAMCGNYANGGTRPFAAPKAEAFDPSHVSSHTVKRESQSVPKTESDTLRASRLLAQADESKVLLEAQAQRAAQRKARIEELKLLLAMLADDDDEDNADERRRTKRELITLLREAPPPIILPHEHHASSAARQESSYSSSSVDARAAKVPRTVLDKGSLGATNAGGVAVIDVDSTPATSCETPISTPIRRAPSANTGGSSQDGSQDGSLSRSAASLATVAGDKVCAPADMLLLQPTTYDERAPTPLASSPLHAPSEHDAFSFDVPPPPGSQLQSSQLSETQSSVTLCNSQCESIGEDRGAHLPPLQVKGTLARGVEMRVGYGDWCEIFDGLGCNVVQLLNDLFADGGGSRSFVEVPTLGRADILVDDVNAGATECNMVAVQYNSIVANFRFKVRHPSPFQVLAFLAHPS